jgi:hypothetical protein
VGFFVELLNEITMIAAVKGLNLLHNIVIQTIIKLEKKHRMMPLHLCTGDVKAGEG